MNVCRVTFLTHCVHIVLPKTRPLGYIVVADSMGLLVTVNLTQLAPTAADF